MIHIQAAKSAAERDFEKKLREAQAQGGSNTGEAATGAPPPPFRRSSRDSFSDDGPEGIGLEGVDNVKFSQEQKISFTEREPLSPPDLDIGVGSPSLAPPAAPPGYTGKAPEYRGRMSQAATAWRKSGAGMPMPGMGMASPGGIEGNTLTLTSHTLSGVDRRKSGMGGVKYGSGKVKGTMASHPLHGSGSETLGL